MAQETLDKPIRRRPWLVILASAIVVLVAGGWAFWDSRQLKWWCCGELWVSELPDGDQLWWQCSRHTGKQVTTCYRSSTPWIDWTFEGTPTAGEHVLKSAISGADMGRFVGLSQEETRHQIPIITGRITLADGKEPVSVTLKPMANMEWISIRRGLAIGPFGWERSAKVLRPDFLPLTEERRELNEFMVTAHSVTLELGTTYGWDYWWHHVKNPRKSPWSISSYSNQDDSLLTEYRPFLVNKKSWSEVIRQTTSAGQQTTINSMGMYPGSVFETSSLARDTKALDSRIWNHVETSLTERGIALGSGHSKSWIGMALTTEGVVLHVGDGPFSTRRSVFNRRFFVAGSCDEWITVPWSELEDLIYADGPFREFTKPSTMD